MKPFAVFDIETDPFKAGRYPQPFVCGFFDGKTTAIFKGKDCVKKCFNLMRRFDGYIYAHNGGKFDFKFLLPLLPKDAKLFAIKGRIAKISFGDVEFRDSYLVLPVPLKAYGKLEIDYRKFEADVRHKWMDEIVTYLKADLSYLYDMVENFVKDYGFGLTMAGRTFAVLKDKFEIMPPKTNEFYDAKFRPYYYGGRVEFFELGKREGPFVVHDINSAYPHAMMSPHVFGSSFITAPTIPTNVKILRGCFITFDGTCLGGLPVRLPDGLSFRPHTGTFSVTGWELEAALDLGTVKINRIIACHRPLELQSFERYVEYFYKMKRAARKGSSEELFAKLFLNSCYGRFALNPREFREVCMTEYGEEPAKEEYGEGWELANDFEDAGISIWEKPTLLRNNSFFNVATAASITGHVRAFLMRSLATVKRPVYCDTDCIISAGSEGLTVGAELGQWKYEGKMQTLWIAGKKLYAGQMEENGKWKTAAKGVRLSPEQICRIAEGEEINSTLDAPTFSLLTGEGFINRTVRRDDKRKRKKPHAN